MNKINLPNSSLLVLRRVNNEQGYVTLVSVLGILFLLTIIGLSMINTAITDKQIVRNDALTKRNFYLAESGANEAAQEIENAATTESAPTAGLAWIDDTGIDFLDKEKWRVSAAGYIWDDTISIPSPNFYSIAGAPVAADSNATHAAANLKALYSSGSPRDDVHFAARFEGVSAGSSLKVTGTTGRLYLFYVYGMYSNQVNGLGEALIEQGYKKRF